MTLAELQAFFARAATSGAGPIEALDDVFVSRGTLDATARLAIYNRAYFYRLLDALGTVFEHTQRALGPSEFERHGLAYLAGHPSMHPSVERVGQHFAEHLRSAEPLLADLAALEWARLRALLAENPTRIASARDALHPEFPSARLRFVPSFELLELDSRALKLFAGLEPDLGSTCTVAVSRRDHIVLHESLSPLESHALREALADAPMSMICALFDAGDVEAGAAHAASTIAGWFARGWVEKLEFTGP